MVNGPSLPLYWLGAHHCQWHRLCGTLVLLCKAPQVMGGFPFHPLFQLLSLQWWGR